MEPAEITAFVAEHPDAAMVTSRADGRAHVARIEVGVVDGRIWTSGSPALVRHAHLVRDLRSTLFVFAGPPDHRWLGLECDVVVLDGPENLDRHVHLLRARHGDAAGPGRVLAHDDAVGHDRPYELDEYAEHLAAEERVIYDFEIRRSYGVL